MKNLSLIAVFLFLGVFCSQGFEGGFREFKSKDGRVITGRIVEGDRRSRKVRVEREHGRKIWVPINLFSEDETEYLKEWFCADQFMSNENIMMSVKEKKKVGRSVQYEIILQNRGSTEYTNLNIAFTLKKWIR